MAAIMAPTSYAKVVKANGLENETDSVSPNENLPVDSAKEKPVPGSPTSKPGQTSLLQVRGHIFYDGKTLRLIILRLS